MEKLPFQNIYSYLVHRFGFLLIMLLLHIGLMIINHLLNMPQLALVFEVEELYDIS